MELNQAINSRRSTRAFTQQPVEREVLEDLLQIASRAPSHSNVQPWKVYVLQGKAKDDLVAKVCDTNKSLITKPEIGRMLRGNCIVTDPSEWLEPYTGRRKENGRDYYNLLNVAKDDKHAMFHAQERNYKFFGAPVGMFFTINTTAPESWLIDCGMFMQTFALAAREKGLSTCFQGAWVKFGKIVLSQIGASEYEKLVCGLSLGYADETDTVNSLKTTRAPVESFTKWIDSN